VVDRLGVGTAREGSRQRALALKLKTAIAASALWAGAAAAAADPGYYVVTVYSNPGVKTVDLRYWTVKPDAGHAVAWPEAGLAWNVTSRWYTELLASWIGSADFATRLNDVEWQNDLLLTQGEYPFDLALHTLWVAPQQMSGDSLEFGPVFQTDIDRTQVNLNIFFERGFGALAARPTQLKYQWQLRYRWRPLLHFGAQGFGELGPWDHWAAHDAQSHRAGPALFGSIGAGPGSIGWQAAYLLGKTYARRGDMLSLRAKYDF
jgi:hypothetical protein